MKSEKGITLISLTIYIIVMMLVVAMVSVVSGYFYTNINAVSDRSDPLIEYTKFNSFFTEEANYKNIKILECKTKYKGNSEANGVENSYIVFDNGVQYTFIAENKGIYRNKIKISKNVEKCQFTNGVQNGKNVVEVKIKIENASEKTVTYTLKN